MCIFLLSCVCVRVCVYLLLGGQFTYAVWFVESEVHHGLKKSNRLLCLTRLTQEMTLQGEDIWTKRKQTVNVNKCTKKNCFVFKQVYHM